MVKSNSDKAEKRWFDGLQTEVQSWYGISNVESKREQV